MKLDEIFPKSCYSESELERSIYSRDASPFEGKCAAVVWPTSREQILNFLQYARRTGVRVTIRGAATSTLGGCVPADAVVIDMSKMNKILQTTNEYVIVEAGVVLDELNKELGKRQFPIIPPEHAACTIGGMIATNTLGLNTYHGKMLDWVEEIEVIDGTGKKLTAKGEQLKDFVGKEGITGIITKAKLRIIPKYSPKTVALFQFHTLKAMMDRVESLNRSPNVLSIEYYDDMSSKIMGLGDGIHILAEFSDDTGTINNRDEIERLDSLKEKLHHILVRKKYTQREDPIIPKENTAQFLHYLRKKNVPCYGHIKMNVFHPCFKEDTKIPQEFYTIVRKLEGKLLAEYPIGIHRKHLLPGYIVDRLKMLKNKYDSSKLLNRGVLVD